MHCCIVSQLLTGTEAFGQGTAQAHGRRTSSPGRDFPEGGGVAEDAEPDGVHGG